MKTISFFQALSYCFGTTSYVICLLIGLLLAGALVFFLLKDYRKTQDWDGGKNFLLFLAVAIFLFALLFRPCEIAANTTVEQFARGVVIGY